MALIATPFLRHVVRRFPLFVCSALFFFICTDGRSDVDGEISVKHILLEASGQVQLHRAVANVSVFFSFFLFHFAD